MRLIDHGASLLRDADLSFVSQHLITDANRTPALYDHDIRNIDGSFAFDNAPGLSSLAIRTFMVFEQVDALHNHFALFCQNLDHASALAFIASGDNDDLVILPDLHFRCHTFVLRKMYRRLSNLRMTRLRNRP